MLGTFLAKRNVPKVYDALGGHDLEAFMRGFSEDATFVYPGDASVSGTYRGKGAIREFFRRWFEQFPEVHFTVRDIAVTNPLDMVGNNVVAVHWEVDLVNREGLEIRNGGVTVITLRRGKVVRAEDYFYDTGRRFRAAWGEAV